MSDELWPCIIQLVIGLYFSAYGLTRKPVEFHPLNPVKRPLPVWAARLLYLPIGVVILGFGIRDLLELFLKR